MKYLDCGVEGRLLTANGQLHLRLAFYMVIKVDVREQRGADFLRRTLSITLNGIVFRPDVFFECSGIAPPEFKVADFAVLATIFFAMRTGDDLHINGTVSRRLLRNLEEFQEAWAQWRPLLYRIIKISADEEIEDTERPKDGCAVVAFSGGIDSVFSLIRHRYNLAGRRTYPPVAACLIQGFDLPLGAQHAFDLAAQTAQRAVAPLDVPLTIMRTNWKAHLCGNWQFEFGAGLASCLHQFTGFASVGLIGADEDYAHLTLPWGSTHVTNPLLSGGAFEIVTEGGGFSRTEKVDLICKHEVLAPTLRVCWEGEYTGRNCGRCEKCVRTKMNFMALGKEPVCFSDGRPTLWQIFMINARSKVQRDFLKEIYSTARANGINELWVSWLAAGIARCYVSAAFRRLKALARLV